MARVLLLLPFCTLLGCNTENRGDKDKGKLPREEAARRASAEVATAIDLTKMNDWDGAAKHCSAALELDADNTSAWWVRGLAHLKKKDFDKAIADCSEAIKRDPGMPAAHRERGKAYSLSGDQARAIADFDVYIRLRPDDSEGYEARALARNRAKDAAGTSADLLKAKELRAKAKRP
ncbi:MAG: tetratricopeptide repeat protein [Gemmataceae bacterium]